MRVSSLCFVAAAASLAAATILQNGQERITNYPVTTIDPSAYDFNTYPASAEELSYKGRWDSEYISWWSAPGLKFGFTGEYVAITFGPYTTNTALIAYRLSGQDWQLTNVTTSGTHLLVSPGTPGLDSNYPVNPSTLELRVTNWAYGVQITSVSVAKDANLVKIPDYGRRIEVIGDSLAAGMYATLEGLASWAYGLGAGLGDTEYSITAWPGICLADQVCWGNPKGMLYQWYYTSDLSGRPKPYQDPEPWNFTKHEPADIVVINLGTNDANSANNVSASAYAAQYKLLIEGIHTVWPDAQIILSSVWNGFYAWGNSYAQGPAFVPEIYEVYQYFNSPEYLSRPILFDHATNRSYASNSSSAPFVSYFNTTGILQHNDIGPQWHPTDVGHLKVASHLIQYIKLKFDWFLYATGPEVQHETQYWNDQSSY